MPKNLEVSIETFTGMTPPKQMEFVVQIFIAIVCLAMISVGINIGGMPAVGIGGASLVGAYIFGNNGYEILVDPKNQKKMNLAYWNQFSCVKIPNEYLDDSGDFTVDLEISKEDALIKAEYARNSGVYLRSNLSNDSTGTFFDAFYIPAGQRVVKAVPATGIDAKAKWAEVTGDVTVEGDKGPDTITGGLFTVKAGENRPIVKNNTVIIKPDTGGVTSMCNRPAAAGTSGTPS